LVIAPTTVIGGCLGLSSSAQTAFPHRCKLQHAFRQRLLFGVCVPAAGLKPATGYVRRVIQMLKVLIAEDELMIADLLEEALVAGGYEVCGIARTVNEGVALGELHKPDLAVLDVRLAKGGRGPEIARQLNSKGKLGVLYATGDDARISALTLGDGEAAITKPYFVEDVLHALVLVREIMTVGVATPPFPRGFRLLREAAMRTVPALPL
jgi:CheY-like chemotaxis protein